MAPRMSRRWVKALLYAALTVIFLVAIVLHYNGVHKIDQIDVSYFRTQRFMMWSGAVLLGIGLSVRRLARADAWFLSLVGGGLLTAFVVMFLQFGGISGAFDATGYAAANAQMVLLDAAMLACFARCAVLSIGVGETTRAKRWTVRTVCAALAVMIVCLLITGCGVRFAQYDAAAGSGLYSEW